MNPRRPQERPRNGKMSPQRPQEGQNEPQQVQIGAEIVFLRDFGCHLGLLLGLNIVDIGAGVLPNIEERS